MSIGWPDLGGALLVVAAFVLIVAGIVGLVVWDARRRGRTHVLLNVTAAIARMWLALAVFGLVVAVWRWVTGGDTWISELPVLMSWPEPLPCSDPGPFETATLVCANVQTVDASIAALSVGTRLILGLGDLLTLALVALPAAVIIVICGHAIKGAPFAAAAARWLFISAIVVLIAGMGAELATSVGRALAAAEVLPPPGGGEVTTTGVFRLSLPLWPVGAALALGALGVVFRHGAALQRDTERLV